MLRLVVPQLIVFAEGNQVRWVEIYQISCLVIYVGKKLSIVLVKPLSPLLTQQLEIVVKCIADVLVEVHIANREIELPLSVEAQHVGSFNHMDTAFLNVTFACEGRTRIRVEYTCADNRSPSAVSSGFYNHANSSDLLFLTFPQDSLLLKETETERVVGKLEKNKGLTYFYYGNIKYELQ
jgi:hypothetical protein